MKEEETFTPSKFSSKENKEDSLDDIDRVQPKTTLTPMTEEGSMAIKEEYIATPNFSGQVELGTASALTTEEGTMTINENLLKLSCSKIKYIWKLHQPSQRKKGLQP